VHPQLTKFITNFSVKVSQKSHGSAAPDQVLAHRQLNWLNLGPGDTLAISVENPYDPREILILISLFSKIISSSSSPLIPVKAVAGQGTRHFLGLSYFEILFHHMSGLSVPLSQQTSPLT